MFPTLSLFKSLVMAAQPSAFSRRHFLPCGGPSCPRPLGNTKVRHLSFQGALTSIHRCSSTNSQERFWPGHRQPMAVAGLDDLERDKGCITYRLAGVAKIGNIY